MSGRVYERGRAIPVALVLWTAVAIAGHEPDLLSADASTCRCDTARAADGWCAKCQLGYYCGVTIRSAALFEVLDLRGHEVDWRRTGCKRCQTLIRDGGFCDDCHMGYIRGRGFFGSVCYRLAQGRVSERSQQRRECCPVPGGWCAKCQRGIVGNRIFLDETECQDAQRAYDLLNQIVQTSHRCSDCAMAMFADSRCPFCRIEYRAGVALSAATRPHVAPASAPTSR